MHRNEKPRHFRPRGTLETRQVQDFVDANPGASVRSEPISLDGDDKPWPCMYPGCLEDGIEDHCLCSLHELRFIASAGKPSPLARDTMEWSERLHSRSEWLKPHWEFSK